MSAPIPTVEPLQLRAGDTWAWRRIDLANTYPAPTWALTYVLKNLNHAYSFNAAADGANFLVTVAAATTATYVGATYRLFGQVVSAGVKYTVYDGALDVIADVFDNPTTPIETRSVAQICLDNINAVCQNRASMDQKMYEIAGRRLERMSIDELIKWREYFAAEVAAEQQASTGRGGRNAYVRFGVNV